MSRLVASLFLLAAAGAVGYFGIQREWQATSAVRADISRLQAISKELTELTAERDRLLEAYRSIPAADLDKLRAVAPARPETAQALVDVESLAAASGVSVSRIEFGAVRDASAGAGAAVGRAIPIPVTLGLQGSYETFKRFLFVLERNLRLTDITAVNFSGGERGALGVSVQGRMYYRP